MAVARNMNELEKMIMDMVKKELPKATREYCHKFYRNHPEMEQIISEESFNKMVNDSFKLSIKDCEFAAELKISLDDNVPEEHIEKMKALWKDFESDYVKYVMNRIVKQYEIKREKYSGEWISTFHYRSVFGL